MTAVIFRCAELADLPDIVALLADDELGKSREDASEPLSPRYVDAFCAIDDDPNQIQAVAVLEGMIIGTLQISFIPGLSRMGAWRGQIEGVRVSASHRREGLGQQMFEWAINECRKRGCDLVQLTTDKARPDAHRFYERLGFVGSHYGYKLLIADMCNSAGALDQTLRK